MGNANSYHECDRAEELDIGRTTQEYTGIIHNDCTPKIYKLQRFQNQYPISIRGPWLSRSTH